MNRIRIALLAVAAVTAVAVIGSAQGAALPKLVGTVGPGFTITLKNASGKSVTSLKAGVYSFVVTDKSNIHNFRLVGGPAGQSKEITGLTFVGTKTASIALVKGTYTYVCDPHAGAMKGTFKVT